MRYLKAPTILLVSKSILEEYQLFFFIYKAYIRFGSQEVKTIYSYQLPVNAKVFSLNLNDSRCVRLKKQTIQVILDKNMPRTKGE